MATDTGRVGDVTVLLYVGLPGADPIEVGSIKVPVYVLQPSGGTNIRLGTLRDIDEAVDYVRESVRTVFTKREDR
jgi:hypothetical protein